MYFQHPKRMGSLPLSCLLHTLPQCEPCCPLLIPPSLLFPFFSLPHNYSQELSTSDQFCSWCSAVSLLTSLKRRSWCWAPAWPRVLCSCLAAIGRHREGALGPPWIICGETGERSYCWGALFTSCFLPLLSAHTHPHLPPAAPLQLGNGVSCIRAALALQSHAERGSKTIPGNSRASRVCCMDVLPPPERVALVRHFSSQGCGFAH